MGTPNAPMNVGDKVEIIAPHPEAGAVGTVAQIYRANAEYERRARVVFGEPYPGQQTVAARCLRVLR